jgi:hypothetical protein
MRAAKGPAFDKKTETLRVCVLQAFFAGFKVKVYPNSI